MTDQPNGDRERAGHAANRPDVSDPAKQGAGKTGAGQEANRSGDAPEKHTEEHQSNYGGGGVNGGTSSDKTTP